MSYVKIGCCAGALSVFLVLFLTRAICWRDYLKRKQWRVGNRLTTEHVAAKLFVPAETVSLQITWATQKWWNSVDFLSAQWNISSLSWSEKSQGCFICTTVWKILTRILSRHAVLHVLFFCWAYALGGYEHHGWGCLRKSKPPAQPVTERSVHSALPNNLIIHVLGL